MNTVSSGAQIHATDLDQVINWLLGTTLSDATVTAVPVGAVQLYCGSAAPTGWLLCNGAAVSRTTYANLFAVCGTTYGAGDGSTTFNVPDLRGRVVVGAGSGSGLTARSNGQTFGEETHTLSFTENGSHSHTGNTGTESLNHQHTATPTAASGYGSGTTYVTAAGSFAGGTVSITTGNESAAHGHGIPLEGGSPHNNVQPSAVLTFIVKV